MLAIAAAVLMLAATAVILFTDWPRLGALTGEASRTPLSLQYDGSREEMASGNSLLTVTGRISNPSDKVRRVPPMRAELLPAPGKAPIYSWSISPPVTELQPGQSVIFNSAEVDVPTSGTRLRVTFRRSI